MSAPTEEQLTAYVLGEGDPATRMMIEAAMRASPALRAQVEELQALCGNVTAELAREPAPRLDAARRAGILAAVDESAAKGKVELPARAGTAAYRRWMAPVGALAVAAAAALVVYPKIRHRTNETPVATAPKGGAADKPSADAPAAHAADKVALSGAKPATPARLAANKSEKFDRARAAAPKKEVAQAGPKAPAESGVRAKKSTTIASSAAAGVAPAVASSSAGGKADVAAKSAAGAGAAPSAAGSASHTAGGKADVAAKSAAGAGAAPSATGSLAADMSSNEKAEPVAAAPTALANHTPPPAPATDFKSTSGGAAGFGAGAGGMLKADEAEAPKPSAKRRSVHQPMITTAQHESASVSPTPAGNGYATVRRYLNDGALPPPDNVRVGELLGHFAFAAGTEVSAAPWAPSHLLARIVTTKSGRLDVRINPKQVSSYRLLAATTGPSGTVTLLYELAPVPSPGGGPLLTVGGTAVPDLRGDSADQRFTAAVAEFALELRRAEPTAAALADAEQRAAGALGDKGDSERQAFLDLVRKARAVSP